MFNMNHQLNGERQMKIECQDRMTIIDTDFVIHWSVEDDSHEIDAVTVDTAEGSCIWFVLDLATKERIKRFIGKRMAEMAQEAKDERAISRWENKKYV